MANEEANRPNPELCLSPIYRNMYLPGPDISEAMELLDCLGNEPWNQPNASAEERQLQWVRGDMVNFAFRNGTLMSDAQRQRHILSSFADPMRPELRRKNLSAESLEFTTFLLKPLEFELDDTANGSTTMAPTLTLTLTLTLTHPDPNPNPNPKP